MDNRKTIIIPALLLLALSSVSGQEVVIGTTSNPALKIHQKTARGKTTDTLELPFIDDFSYPGVYPDERLWEDNYVYINNNYSKNQITTGVATFDILDSKGEIYDNASTYPFEADKLTSLPINLDYGSDENVRLSFFFESGGVADKPELTDNLILYFYAPEEDKWEEVWRNDDVDFEGFKPVILGITEEKFLKKGFRFRFVNNASLGNINADPSMVGNCDQWNLDYVVIDKNREANDTIMADVAFKYPNRSLLKSYEAIPWKQFKKIYLQEMESSFNMAYRNNDNIVRNVTREFQITDLYTGTIIRRFSGGATNIAAQTDVYYDAELFYKLDSINNDSAIFEVKSWLITDEFDRKENDTVVYYQYFTDYYGYDDGSAEGGYGINGLGASNAMAALRFRSYERDTIYAVRICFNESYKKSNITNFDLIIWDEDEINKRPGNILLELEDRTVVKGDGINGFFTYKLPYPIPVDGAFYVGWRQHSELFLNVGLDLNTHPDGRQHYWINGNWYVSQVEGTLMIRPVAGFPLITGNNEITMPGESNKTRFWPNPATAHIYIDTEGYNRNSDFISITDLLGRKLISQPLTDYIDISSIPAGYYIVTITRENQTLSVNRLIKTH